MLTLCGPNRRGFLQAGAIGMGGLTLPQLLRARAAAGTADPSNDTSIIWLFLRGGPSQYETFDPKPGNPLPYRSTVGAVQTSVPGTMLGGTFPKLARLADKFSIIRSFAHTAADHAAATHWLMTGHDYPAAANPGTPPVQPGLGAILARYRGPNVADSGLPTYVTLENNHQFYAEGPSWLGAAYGPFRARGNDLPSMTPTIPLERVAHRRGLLQSLDNMNRQLDQSGAMQGLDQFQALAVEMIRGRAQQAFDLSQEDPRLRELYGQGRKNIGENLLLARRLVEEGIGLVTVMYGDWDSHGTNPANEYGTIEQDMYRLAPDLDHALSVFVQDLYDRGLEKKVLLAVVSEFGRSPHINKDGGREHWPRQGNQVLVGGGMNMGQIIGESSEKGDEPKSAPISPNDLLATFFKHLKIPADLQYINPSGRPTPMLPAGQPIAALW